MKKSFKIIIVLIVLAAALFWAAQSKNVIIESENSNDQTEQTPPSPAGNEIAGMRLNDCIEENLRIRFLCDYSWNDQNEDPNAIFYAISSAPDVKIKIAKIPIDILYIQELSREKLEAIGHYTKGFAVENTEVSGYSALKIKAFSSKKSQMRLLDYYFVRDNGLFILMFSVDPKGEWSNYKFLFQEIVKSLTFY